MHEAIDVLERHAGIRYDQRAVLALAATYRASARRQGGRGA